jgi:spermidine/putrescine transport system substrate-binding protein
MRHTRFLRFAALLGATVLVMSACSDDETSSPADTASETTASASPEPLGGTLVISNWDAYMPDDLIANFEEETGVTVELAIHTTNEDIMGKLQASNGTGFDLVFVSGQFVKPLVDLGYAAAIDQSQIPNLANLYPEATQLAYDPGNTHSVPYTWGTTGICYRTDLLDEVPSSWEVFRAPPAGAEGKMTMLGTDRWLLQPALLSLGYSVNATDQGQLDEAAAWTQEAKGNLLAFDDTTFYSKLAAGEASLVHAWDGWCEYGRLENPKIDFVVPDEGSDLWADTMVVMESSENKAAAHAFIDYVLSEEVHRSVSEFVLYKVPNQPATEGIDPAVVKEFPTLGITPAELMEGEEILDLGADGTQAWTETVTEVKAA